MFFFPMKIAWRWSDGEFQLQFQLPFMSSLRHTADDSSLALVLLLIQAHSKPVQEVNQYLENHSEWELKSIKNLIDQ